MATFNYILGRKKNNGRYPICLMIRNGHSNTPMSLGLETIKSDWNDNSQRVVVRAKDTYQMRQDKEDTNEYLDLFMQRVKEVERVLQKRGLGEMTATQIKEFIINYNPNSKSIEGKGDFVAYFNRIANDKPKSRDKYEGTLKSLIAYNRCRDEYNGQEQIRFNDITAEFIRRYINYLKELPYNASKKKGGLLYKNYSVATQQTYISVLKRVLNCAIDDNKVSADAMKGFRGYKMPSVPNDVFTLTIEQLREMLRYPLHEGSRLKMTRDLFIFSFCCRGMNLEDMFFLKRKDVRLPYIDYVRKKTQHISQQKITISLEGYEDKVFELIKPYTAKYNQWHEKCDDDYYFALPFHYFQWQGNRGYDNFAGYVQKDMRALRKIFNLPPEFRFYTARHTFSTILSDDSGKETYVDASLGHSPKSISGKHYIGIDYDKLNKYHQEILSRLFEE